jgi:D-amino-acid oxidase
METLDELMALAKPGYSDTNLVEIVPAVSLLQSHGGPQVEDFARNKYTAQPGGSTETDALPEWTKDPRIAFQHVTVEMLSWQNTVHKMKIPNEKVLKEAGYLHAWFFRPPIVNSPAMLQDMLNELVQGGADVQVETKRYYKSIDEMRQDAAELGCDTVVNCTGLGSRNLLNDAQLIGARGVLLHFNRAQCVRNASAAETANGEPTTQDAIIMAEEAPWGTDTHPAYLIARGNTVVVGGTYLEGDGEPSIRPEERTQIYKNASLLGLDVEKSPVIGEWVGFRPYRPLVRCEYDSVFNRSIEGVKVFHNFGHGGSGWTVNVGAANECVDALLCG